MIRAKMSAKKEFLNLIILTISFIDIPINTVLSFDNEFKFEIDRATV